jgi:photosynthetic reaction center cytochrome c subunit
MHAFRRFAEKGDKGNMELGSRRTVAAFLGTAMVCLLCAALASGQTTTQEKPLLAEQIFKNVQVLRGIPVDEFMGTMGFFAASLSLNCTECHVPDAINSLDKYADDTPIKQTARKMILMVKMLNQSYFGGKREVTCYTCHHTGDIPKVAPSLAEQYGTPPDDPNEVEILGSPAPGAPSVDQILGKYVQALGGTQRLTSLTSFVAKGSYIGFDTDEREVPIEIYAKAPGQRTTVAHAQAGDNIRTFDGRAGWIATNGGLLPLLALTGGDLDGAKFDANLSFPGAIKQDLSEWRSGFPTTTIDDREVEVVEGNTAGKSPVKLYFDKESGLLVRQVRYRDTAVGPIPTQIDYSDYREVSGIKMAFHWTVTWTDGRSTTEVSDVQTNVPIDASKFAQPAAAPAPPKPATR